MATRPDQTEPKTHALADHLNGQEVTHQHDGASAPQRNSAPHLAQRFRAQAVSVRASVSGTVSGAIARTIAQRATSVLRHDLT